MHRARMSKPSTPLPILVIIFVAIQLFLPLSYYWGENVYDERFAWRMFSPIRMAKCSIRVYSVRNGERTPLNLAKRYHVAWVNLAKRARPDVLHGMMRDLCSTYSDVRLSVSCDTPEAARVGVCIDPRDRDGDGVPDGYRRRLGCNLPSPESCFQADCGAQDTSTCIQSKCRTQLFRPDVNQCDKDRG